MHHRGRAADDRFLDHRGARLRWRLEGRPDPAAVSMVLVHGWALSLEYWDPVMRQLVPEFGVLRYDRRGFGQTQGPYDPGLACDDLLALLDAAGIGRACLVGMSQGARVAIHTAIRAPHRVSAVVLDAAPWFEDEPELPLDDYRRLRDGQGVEAMQAAILAHPLMRLAAPDPHRQSLLRRCVGSYRGVDLDGGWQPVPPPELDAITQSTLVICGEQDSAHRRETADRLREAIPGATAMRVEDAAHLVALDRPRQWAEAVVGFLTE